MNFSPSPSVPRKRHASNSTTITPSLDYPSREQSLSISQPYMPLGYHMEPAPNALQPKQPCPDLSIGLRDSEASWAEHNGLWRSTGLRGNNNGITQILADLQACGTLISDPCTSEPSGLRFPFLVVEAKSGGSSTLVEAENQAAVSGACSLGILRTLAGERSTMDETISSFSLRTFSLTTDVAIHVLLAHCEETGGSSMVWLGIYRITDEKSAQELVEM